MKLRTAVLLSPMLLTGCGASVRQDSQPVTPIARSWHDLALARTVLEGGGGESIFLPAHQLDSLAVAFAILRTVDSLSAAELASDVFERVGAEILMDIDAIRSGGPVRPLVDSLARCAGVRSSATTPSRFVPGSAVPFPRACWSALDSALAPVSDAVVRIVSLHEDALTITVTTPPTVDRHVLVARIRRFTGLERGLYLNSVVVGGSNRRMTREGPIWRFRFTHGAGDCAAGCMWNRHFEYRFDSRTGRGWKHSESGDPYPPPSNVKKPFERPPTTLAADLIR